MLIGGQTLGALDAQKRAFADSQNYGEAKEKKFELDQKRDELYKELEISQLLELPLPSMKPKSPRGELPPPTRIKSQRTRTSSNSSRDSGIEESVPSSSRMRYQGGAYGGGSNGSRNKRRLEDDSEGY